MSCSKSYEFQNKEFQVVLRSLRKQLDIQQKLKNIKYNVQVPDSQCLFMSVGRLIHVDLSNSESIKVAKHYYEGMLENINDDFDWVQRYYIVGDSCKCNEENPRQISFEEASTHFSEVIYVEVNCTTGLKMLELQQMIVENLHQEASLKHRNLIEEQSRNPRCNWWINHILSFLLFILLFVGSMLIFGMFFGSV